MKNGYAAATGWQYLPSSARDHRGDDTGMSIEAAIRGLGVRWMKTVRTYDIAKMVKTLRRAMTTTEKGLKVIIAEGECMLARQRRVRPETAKRIAEGKRVVRTRFGVDDDVCTGDRACIRLSGCPSITIKPNPDPLRSDPVAHVDNDCVGCGVCGEVADRLRSRRRRLQGAMAEPKKTTSRRCFGKSTHDTWENGCFQPATRQRQETAYALAVDTLHSQAGTVILLPLATRSPVRVSRTYH